MRNVFWRYLSPTIFYCCIPIYFNFGEITLFLK